MAERLAAMTGMWGLRLMSLYLLGFLGWVVALVVWIALVVRGMERATSGEPASPGLLLGGLTLLVCLPFLAVMLPFQVPAVLCRGHGRPAFWAFTALYLSLLWLFAVSALRTDFVEAAVVLLVGGLAYGRPPGLRSPGTDSFNGRSGWIPRANNPDDQAG